MKIFLLGYMGSGKSTIGKLLAEKINLRFLDFDRYIEIGTGKTIAEIFDLQGEEKFRTLEHEFLKKILEKDNIIVSLGGGTPCFHNNMELINKNGISVFIQMSLPTIVSRLAKARNKRPLIRDLNEVDLQFFVEANLEKRLAFYAKAHCTINAENKTPEQIANEIQLFLQKETE